MSRSGLQMGKNKTHWNIPVSLMLDQAVEYAVERDSHSSKSEYVRDAVRRMLETHEKVESRSNGLQRQNRLSVLEEHPNEK